MTTLTQRSRRVRESRSVQLLALIAAAVVLSLGSRFFVPLTLGVLLAALLHPAVTALRRMRVPPMLGAAIAVLLSIVIIVIGVMLLEPPIRSLTRDIPKTLMSARGRFESLGIPLPGGSAASGGGGAGAPKVAGAAPPGRDSSAARAPNGGPQSQPAGIGQTITRAFGVTVGVLFGLVEVLLLAFFILAAGDQWNEKLRRSAASPEQADRVLDTVSEMKRVVLRYLWVNLLINAAQAILIALIVWPLGYAAPAIWGVLTFVAEFVPYFGGAMMIGLLFLTGLATGGGFVHATIAPLAYLLITTLQNNLVSPAAYGRGLRLNPTAILVAVMFWGLVWGIAGVFLAVPLLAAMRIVAERSESWRSFATFLSD